MRSMMRTRKVLLGFTVACFITATAGSIVLAQQFTSKTPTAADWAALAKLPDFTGVWERGGGGGGGNQAAAAALGTAPPRGNQGLPPAAGAAAAAAGRGAGGAGRGAAAGGRGGGGPSFTPEYEA